MNPGTLEDWRQALKRVSNISGFELETYNGDEGKLLDDLAQCVLKKLSKTGLNVAKYPTGLEEKVADFERILAVQEEGQRGKVKVMGIVGMGGIGKTTLAKELFNKKSSNFGESCFLFNVRENASRRSLNSLQAKVIKDLVHRDVQIDHIDEGTEVLKTYLKTSPHALVVLDDVDHADQLNAFLPLKDVLRSDSLILVTSRYKDVLISSGLVESSIYKLTGLNKQHSQQLFCLHAFCNPHSPSGFKDLVDEFCRACDGLPLSLKVFGGLLCGKSDISYWKELLNKLGQIKLPNEIQRSLKLSYDALEQEEKQIFLDMACYFIGENRDMAIRVWDGSGRNGLLGFENLQDKSLVEVDTGNTIKMHDHLRDLGRHIADQEKSSGVIPHRLWRVIENIPELWRQYSVTTEVRGVRTVPRLKRYHELQVLRRYHGFTGNSEKGSSSLKNWYRYPSSHGLSNLQLVATENDGLKSILSRVKSPNLIWLRWSNCPNNSLPPWILMKNTRVLEVSGKKLSTLWHTKSQAPLELRELTVHSPYSPLFKFPKSIGQLKHIEKIVANSSNLKSLPKEFCEMQSLRYLDLSNCPLLQMLPDSFGYLTNLQHLDLSNCPLSQMLPDSFGYLTNLPNSFGALTNLLHLDLNFSVSLQTLPNSFGNLIRLKYLNLDLCTKLTLSDETFSNIRSLEYLSLSCREMLPWQVAHQQSLEKLYLYPTRLRELPEDIGNPSNLEVFELGSCRSLKKLPCSLGHLSSLKHFRLLYCEELKSLPASLGLLTQLSVLSIQFCGIQYLPAELVKLNNLIELTVINSPIRELPLKRGMEGAGAPIELFRLEFLQLQRTKISEISFVEGVCPSLKHLKISFCNDLVEVGALPPTLINLSLDHCHKLRKIKRLYNLRNLRELNIRHCGEVQELLCLESLTSLKRFRAAACCKLKRTGGLERLTQLQEVSVVRCDALEEIASVQDLMMRLKRLYVADCPKLRGGVEEQVRQRYAESMETRNYSSSEVSGDDE